MSPEGDAALDGGPGAVATQERAPTADVEVAPRARRFGGRGPVDDGSGEGSRWLLIVCCVAQFMVILDLSIVNVALPSIQFDLGFSAPDLQWVVNAYAITFAGFLMLGGRAADHFGQRRMFVAALALFALASLAGGAAPNRGMLIGARGVQGLAGALMAASSLAIITSSFPPGPKLHRAIGIWAAMNGAGGAAGTLFGGIITQELSWRWVLLINPPIAVAAVVVAYMVVADRRRTRSGASFDLAGALTLTIGQMVLVYGVVKAGTDGWDSLVADVPIAAGLALLAVFGVIESRIATAPLIPFRDLTKPLKVANGIVLLFSAALFPMWFISSLYLQQVLGLSPEDTGLTFLPMALAIMLVASRAGKLVSRFGVRSVLGGGLTLMTAGMLLFTRIHADGSPIVYVMIPGLLTAVGIAMSIVPSTIAATQGARQGQAGLASGLVNTSRQVGGGLGLALLITLATQHTTHLIGAGHSVPQALTDGFKLAYWICAAFCAAAALATFLLVPRTAASGASAIRRAGVAVGVAVVLAGFAVIALATAGNHGAPIGAYSLKNTLSFVTEPSLHPPKLRIFASSPDNELGPGYILTTNSYDLSFPPMKGQSGPLILDNHMQPVWFKPVPTDVVASSLDVHTYRGEPVLSWWQGVVTNTGQTLSGEDIFVDRHYQQVASIKSQGGWFITLHELLVDGDHAWVTANRNLPMNLSKYGGAYNGALVDSAVQEYSISTGKLLYTWDALKHIPLSDSQASLPANGFPWDAYHVNSISLVPGGFVVSMRDTWAAYRVDFKTGNIVWTLGGKHSSFTFGKNARFEWQHDVKMQPGGIVTVFDDHCCQLTGGGTFVTPSASSRALVLRLDETTHTATRVAEYDHGKNFDAAYMGNTQPLPNGNVFVGWGSQPFLSEFTRQGDVLLDAEFPRPDQTYRTIRAPWDGVPLSSPVGAARGSGGKLVVYASWNGATRLAAWRVLGGSQSGSLRAVAAVRKGGFETAIPVAAGLNTFQVQALDSGGRVIGTSRPFGLSH